MIYSDPSGNNPAAACLIPGVGAACAAAASAAVQGIFFVGALAVDIYNDLTASEKFDTIQDGQKVIQQPAANQGYTVLQQPWFQSGSGVYQQNKVRIMPKEQFDLAPASVQGSILGSGVILFDVGTFEHKIAHLNSNERVAEVRSTAQVIAAAKGLVKSSGLTKLNNRDVYLDTATGNLYAVDTQHGRFELTNSKGKHLGELNFNFESTKPADSSGRHNLKTR